MPTDPSSGDIQITAAGPAPTSPASQTPGPAAASTGQQPVAQAPVVTTPVVAPAAAQPAVPAQPAAPAQPVNKKAFNLEEGVAEASTGPVKPDKFAIPKIVREKYPDLVELIKVTESMDDQERQYWFQILPVMTPEQVEKFRGILVTEKEQLAQLDKEYEDELNRLNDKHLLEWKEFESKEKSKAIKDAEAKSSEEEKKMEEDLLAKLSNV